MRWNVCLAVAVAGLLFLGAAPALAYNETTATPSPGCNVCHGIEEGETSPTVGPRDPFGTRKGPHGGYTTGTNKCETCHTLHGAASARSLLPQQTIAATCNTCHDGTGGGGVYGAIKQRTGEEPAAQHRIDTATNGRIAVPGGDPDGGSLDRTFSGETGGLTCTDCHNPHDSGTIEPFVGDRSRSASDTTTAIASNRLLRNKPTSGDTTVTAYGTDWCEACHKGRHAIGSGSSTGMNHPTADETSTPSADYSNAFLMAGYDTTKVVDAEDKRVKGSMGQTNLGYIVPEDSGGMPICQQCHEDARVIGNTVLGQVDSQAESFTAPPDGSVAGNPRFQNFPHETMNRRMLVETGDSLCTNCHYSGAQVGN